MVLVLVMPGSISGAGFHGGEDVDQPGMIAAFGNDALTGLSRNQRGCNHLTIVAQRQQLAIQPVSAGQPHSRTTAPHHRTPDSNARPASPLSTPYWQSHLLIPAPHGLPVPRLPQCSPYAHPAQYTPGTCGLTVPAKPPPVPMPFRSEPLLQ